MSEETEEEKLEAARKLVAEDDAVKAEQKKLDEEQIKGSKETPVEKEHPDDKISRAEAVAERIEEANKIGAQQLEELRTLKVNEALGGKSELSEKQTQEEKDTASAQALVPKDMLDLSKPVD